MVPTANTKMVSISNPGIKKKAAEMENESKMMKEIRKINIVKIKKKKKSSSEERRKIKVVEMQRCCSSSGGAGETRGSSGGGPVT